MCLIKQEKEGIVTARKSLRQEQKKEKGERKYSKPKNEAMAAQNNTKNKEG
jgi:hypothetical protein